LQAVTQKQFAEDGNGQTWVVLKIGDSHPLVWQSYRFPLF